MRYSEIIQAFLSLIEDTRSEFPKECEGVGQMDKLKCDLEHAFEFNTGNEDYITLGREMEECLRQRRTHKNNVELMNPVMDYMRENKKAIDRLSTLLKEVNKIEKQQSERIYTPRVRKEIPHDDAGSDEAGGGEHETGVLDGSKVETPAGI